MLFMGGLISILVGAMASVREIVKEIDIYKRERAINLKLPRTSCRRSGWASALRSIRRSCLLLFL